jgi:hypothetical protein
MAFRKRKLSAKVTTAKNRLEGINSIDPEIDLGNGLTKTTYETEIQNVELKYEKYNQLLSEIDGLSTELKQSEQNLGDLSQRMLNAVGTRFGYNSAEYKKAGGTPKREKRRASKKTASAKQAA